MIILTDDVLEAVNGGVAEETSEELVESSEDE